MGGHGSGGRRPGAGQPPKSLADHAVAGTRSRSRRLLLYPPSGIVGERVTAGEMNRATREAEPAEPIDPPKGMSKAAAALWRELAPHATAAGTLVPATVVAFVLLLDHLLILRAFARKPKTRGLSAHRSMMQRVDIELRCFGLAPEGKPMAAVAAATAAPVNPLDRFLAGKGGA